VDDSIIPLDFIPVKWTQLHPIWDYMEAGLHDILKKYPNLDWRAEDIYSAIQGQRAEAFIMMRASKKLGFFVAYVFTEPYSQRQEYFIWACWDVPLAEREDADHCSLGREDVRRFMIQRAKSLKCKRVSTASPRKGFERFGFVPQVIHYFLDV
jgi:hypothetical protein